MGEIVHSWKKVLEDNWGLSNFDLRSSTIHREVSPIKITEYKLDMEWFPPGAEMEDDLNPPGTVAASVNLTYGILTSFIVVMREDHRNNPPSLPSSKLDDIVAWIELHTGLRHEVDFQYVRKDKEDGCVEYFFTSILNGKKLSPGGWIEVKVNGEGSVVFYSLHGYFPAFFPAVEIEHNSKPDAAYMEEVKRGQVILFGTLEDTEYKLLYGVEEEFVDGNLLPGEDEIIVGWKETDPLMEVQIAEQPIGEDWEDFRLSQTITEEEIAKNIPHPDTIPITTDEKSRSIQLIANYLRKKYPEQNGKWKVEKIERDYGNIHVEVVPVDVLDRLIDKLKFIYDPEKEEIVGVLDKREMFSQFMDIPSPPIEEITISQKQAVAILNDDIFFEEYYVYDREQNKLKLMYRIDCNSFVDAVTGEVSKNPADE